MGTSATAANANIKKTTDAARQERRGKAAIAERVKQGDGIVCQG
jgi:hypothetical protein